MKSRILAGLAAGALCVVFSGCAKKPVAASTTPPTPRVEPRTTPAPSRQVTPTPPSTSASSTPASTPRMPDAATKARIQDLLDRIQDAYFDYNKHNLRPDAEATLQKDAQALGDIIRQYPDYKLTVQGHCDERGSEEYNLALGDKRAEQAKEYLATLGVPGNQLQIISYGKDKPVCEDHDEACWQRNRRAHITQEQ